MKKLKRKFITGTAFAVGAAASIMGCSPPVSVYGPPPSSNIEQTETTSFENEDINAASGAFDPATEVQEDVYGPPEWFGNVPEEEASQ